MTEPKIAKIVNESGEISDDLDYALANFLLAQRGAGFTACRPQLVELEDQTKAIKMMIDHTYIGKDNNVYGLGIVGYIYISTTDYSIIFCTPLGEMEVNIQVLKDSGVEAQVRPKGKY